VLWRDDHRDLHALDFGSGRRVCGPRRQALGAHRCGRSDNQQGTGRAGGGVHGERCHAALAGLPNLEAASLDYVVDWGVDNTPIAAVKDFARVRRAPMGFMLIRRSVVQRLREAHPELRYKPISRHGDYAKDLPYRFALFESTIEEGGLYLTEDYAFCRRWTELGGEIWLDIKSRLTHYGPQAFRGDLLQQFRKPSEP
jgi:hypothetical protein